MRIAAHILREIQSLGPNDLLIDALIYWLISHTSDISWHFIRVRLGQFRATLTLTHTLDDDGDVEDDDYI